MAELERKLAGSVSHDFVANLKMSFDSDFADFKIKIDDCMNLTASLKTDITNSADELNEVIDRVARCEQHIGQPVENDDLLAQVKELSEMVGSG